MQPDLPTQADVTRRLSLQNTSVGEAREKLIQFLTEHWLSSLTELAEKLTQQGFPSGEVLQLCESYRPRFEESLTEALTQFDRNADSFIAARGEASDG